ncbi:AAEL006284-PA [Aedes aegypti]|uniref:AAEL006284-PA n=1 Tax=Aedes aegypti TaxID=7159 RepID=Q176S1_AEDAE|nr:AAEL006284-PA [Aedes aegypti]
MNTRRDVSTKRTKPDETSNSTDEMSVAQLAQWISNKLDSTKDELAKQINDGMLSVKMEIKSELDSMRSQLDKSISDLNRSVQANKEAIHSTASTLSRSQYSNENLMEYFDIWCNQLGYSSTPLVDIRRLSKQPMTVGKSYKILLQFAEIINQRCDFYYKYIRTRTLTLDQIGFKSNDRIFVNENLTPIAREIKNKALLARKDGKLQAVFSRNGEICIKKTVEAGVIPISSVDHLNNIIHQS